MPEESSPRYAVLLLFAALLGLGVLGMVLRIWSGVLAAVALAVMLLPAGKQELKSALKGTRLEGKLPTLGIHLSRAQHLAALGVLLLALGAWRAIEDGLATFVLVLVASTGYTGWFVYVLRKEGWSGQRASKTEPD